jgi:putative peptidoglycan lipid II flippase
MNDSITSILKSAKSFLSGTLISRVTGLLRDIVMAASFGTQPAVAAFMVAFRFSHLLRRLLGEGCMQTAFIPHFEELRKANPKEAFSFFCNLTAVLSLLLVVIISLVMGGLWLAMKGLDLSPGNQEILYYTFILMPGLLFICLYGLNAALLQCEKHFFLSGVAPVGFNLIWIVSAWVLGGVALTTAMPWMSFALVIGAAVQWLVTVPRVWKLIQSQSIRSIKLYSPHLIRLGVPLFLGMIGVASTQFNSAVDSIFARYADPEGPAFLWYSIRIQQFPLAIFGIALSGALLPPLARASKENNWFQFNKFLDFALLKSFAFMLPTTLAIILLAPSCIQLVYARGDFGSDALIGTSRCLWGYVIGLVPMTWVLIYAPAFYSQNNYKITTQASVTSMIANIVFNSVMVAYMGLGAASVALGTSLSGFVNYGILKWAFDKREGAKNSFFSQPEALKIVFVSLIATAVTLSFEYFVWGEIFSLRILLGHAINLNRTFVEQVTYIAVQTAVFCGSLFSLSWLTRTKSLLQLSE